MLDLLMYLDEGIVKNLSSMVLSGYIEIRTTRIIQDRTLSGRTGAEYREHYFDEDRCGEDEREGYKGSNCSKAEHKENTNRNDMGLENREFIRREEELKRVYTTFTLHRELVTQLETKHLIKEFDNKTINIVTNHIEKFKRLEKQLQEYEGIIITITNNKKKSLMKSQIILNIDFPKELINKYKINEDSIIVNIKGKIKITQKRFNGLNINDYEIDYRDDKKNVKAFNNNYYLKDLYESELYKKQRINEVKEKIKLDKVIIRKLILNNGEL